MRRQSIFSDGAFLFFVPKLCRGKEKLYLCTRKAKKDECCFDR